MMKVDRLLRAIASIVSVVGLLAVHGPLIGYRAFANVDEAYAAALASRLLEGHKLYEGAISQRGPLMYYLYALIARLTGWDNVMALRIWTLLVILGIVFMTGRLGTKLVSHTVGSLAIAFTAYLFIAGVPAIDGLALHGETLQAPFIVGGALLGFSAVRERKRGWLVASGILFGLAVCIKQSVLIQPLPVVLLLLSKVRRDRRWPVAELVVFTIGVLLPIASFLLHAAVSGTLSALFYYTVTYNLQVHLQPSTSFFDRAAMDPFGDLLMRMPAFAITLFGTVGATLIFLTRRFTASGRARSYRPLLRGFGAKRYIAAHALVACVSALSMRRFFPHYFLPALPFLAVLAAAWITRRMRGTQLSPRRVGWVACAMVIIYAGFLANAYERLDGRVTHSNRVTNIARYIEETTKPSSRIFVWGFSPWFYEYAHRRPAGRYLFETYVTGFVPWYWGSFPLEKGRVVPGSLEALISDLEKEDPEIVVDAGAAIIARPMRAYELASQFLHSRYCFEVRVGGYDLYRRKGPEGCKSDLFPTQHPPIDFFDTTLGMGMPFAVDAATSKPLCGPIEGEPMWFVEPEHAALLARRNAAKEREEHQKEGLAYPHELGDSKACGGDR